MTKFTLNSGTNKSNRRIWIEGSRLLSAGFSQGDRLSKRITSNRLILQKTTDQSEAKHRIAGKPDRPILDLCGKWVTVFMDGKPSFSVTIKGDTITISPTA